MLKGFTVDPDGTTLASPATITLPYNTSQFSTTQGVPLEEFLSAYNADPTTGLLTGLTGFSVDTTKHTISGTVPHFSAYLVTNAFRLCAPPQSESDCPSSLPEETASNNLPAIVIHGFRLTLSGMGDESTWGQLRYMLNAVDNQGPGRIDAWRFDWDSLWASSKSGGAWFARTAGNLEQSINEVKHLTGQTSVNLLAHSFGGIVARAYIQGSATNANGTIVPFQNDVTKVMTLGTPHRGIGGDNAEVWPDACALLPLDVQPDTCFEANTGAPQLSGEGSFLAQLNTLPIPPSLVAFKVVRGQTLDLGGLVLNTHDGFITSTGDDFCGADPAISCTSGVVTDQLIAESISDKVGLCHSDPTSPFVFCAPGLNVAMAQVDDKTHPLWQEVCTFLGGDPTKCEPQLTVTISPASPAGGVVTSDANDPGIDCGTSCQAAYSAGTNVTLTATPSSGFIFTGWSGDCTGTSPCVVTMNNDRVVAANFSSHSIQISSVTCSLGNPVGGQPVATVQVQGSVYDSSDNPIFEMNICTIGGISSSSMNCGQWTNLNGCSCQRDTGQPSSTQWVSTTIDYESQIPNPIGVTLSDDFIEVANATASYTCQ